MFKLIIVIKTIPPTINKYIGRSNIFQYQNDKKKVHKAIVLETAGINPKIKKCNMKVTYYFQDKRRRDPGNYDKMLLDSLVEANIIEDDNYTVIQEYTTVGKVDSKKPRVEIEIQPL